MPKQKEPVIEDYGLTLKVRGLSYLSHKWDDTIPTMIRQHHIQKILEATATKEIVATLIKAGLSTQDTTLMLTKLYPKDSAKKLLEGLDK